jgi:hypothetical protein
MEVRAVGAVLVYEDRRADVEKLIDVFCDYANVPTKGI